MDRLSRRGVAAAAVLAAVSLGGVWRLAPASPPIYDGCITEPYRLLGQSPAPSAASHGYPAGTSQPAEVITDEAPAQAQVLMMAGTFSSPLPYTVTITPIRQPQPPPGGRSFDGNVYRIVAGASDGRPVQPRQPVTVVLRATASGGAARVMLRLDGGVWTQLKTFSAGCGDEYEALSPRFGVFAMALAAGQGAGSGSGGIPALVVAPIVAAVLLVAVVLLLRLNRSARP